jgi:hypothetical protein
MGILQRLVVIFLTDFSRDGKGTALCKPGIKTMRQKRDVIVGRVDNYSFSRFPEG